MKPGGMTHTCCNGADKVPFRLKVAGNADVLEVLFAPFAQHAHEPVQDIQRDPVRLGCGPP